MLSPLLCRQRQKRAIEKPKEMKISKQGVSPHQLLAQLSLLSKLVISTSLMKSPKYYNPRVS